MENTKPAASRSVGAVPRQHGPTLKHAPTCSFSCSFFYFYLSMLSTYNSLLFYIKNQNLCMLVVVVEAVALLIIV